MSGLPRCVAGDKTVVEVFLRFNLFVAKHVEPFVEVTPNLERCFLADRCRTGEKFRHRDDSVACEHVNARSVCARRRVRGRGLVQRQEYWSYSRWGMPRCAARSGQLRRFRVDASLVPQRDVASVVAVLAAHVGGKTHDRILVCGGADVKVDVVA
jgi:hypothetical protein